MDNLGSLNDFVSKTVPPSPLIRFFNSQLNPSKQKPFKNLKLQALKRKSKPQTALGVIDLQTKGFQFDSSKRGYILDFSISQRHKRAASQFQNQLPPVSTQRRRRGVNSSLPTQRHSPRQNHKPNLPFDSFQANIRTELLMKHDHYILHNLKQKCSNTDKVSKTSNSAYQTRFKEFSRAMMNLHRTGVPPAPLFQNQYRGDVVTYSTLTADHIAKTGTQKLWMNKRGIGQQTDLHLTHFGNALFELLDDKKQGVISCDVLLQNLLGLGIATSHTILQKSLCIIFNKKKLRGECLQRQQFKSIFKSDPKTDFILFKLDELCLELREKELMRTKTKQFKFRIVNSESPKQRKPVTISQHQQIIDKWWTELDYQQRDIVPTITVATKLADLKITVDINQGRMLIIYILGNKPEMSKNHFQEIFAKSMLKGALINLSKRLYSGNFASAEMSSAYQLGCYKRALILSGVRCPNSQLTVDEGASALQAIEKFTRKESPHLRRLPEEEIKSNILKLAGISVEDAERNSSFIKYSLKKKPQEKKTTSPQRSVTAFVELNVNTEKSQENLEEVVYEKMEVDSQKLDEGPVEPQYVEMECKSPNVRFFKSVQSPRRSMTIGNVNLEKFELVPEHEILDIRILRDD